MKSEKISSAVEVYICNHSREKDEDCARRGSRELTDNLRKWAKENHKGELKIYRGGCLGKCSEGIAIACYPDKKFILDAKPTDLEEIKNEIYQSLSKN
jgi:predicted metal-binding protein